MKVLIIKMTSMGDVIHTFPALTDASKQYSDIQFDWVVEKSFEELPKWHDAVNQVIPVKLRHWRKNIIKTIKDPDFKHTWEALRKDKYDLVIDAQGLLKSAIISRCIKGKQVGFNRQSARESFASVFYQKTYSINKKQHAVMRTRQLFANALGYSLSNSHPDFAIKKAFSNAPSHENYLLFLHGTTWPNKHWPEHYWAELIDRIKTSHYQVYLPWGSPAEYERAVRLAHQKNHVKVLPKMGLTELGNYIANAEGIVAQDSGLAHLAAAVDVPTVAVYGPTDPKLSGTVGNYNLNIAANFPCAPCLKRKCSYYGDVAIKPACFSSITPEIVWHNLTEIIS